MESLINQHRCHIDPQAIILANSEMGNLQKYYVRPRYKEMVKGCGGSRTQYTSMWAGITQPGDGWMNDVLKCYWRELEADSFERDLWTSRSDNNKTPDENKNEPTSDADREEEKIMSEMMRRLDLMTARSSNPHVLDVIHIDKVITWIKSTRTSPHLHSAATLEVVEIAVEKMGGWKFVDIFSYNWIRQFYLPAGRIGIPFPLPGCKSWLPAFECPSPAGFSSTPLSLSLQELNQLAPKEPPPNSSPSKRSQPKLSMTPPADFPLVGPTNPLQDQKYWDYLWLSVCRELLEVHELLDTELDGGEIGLQRWMEQVEHCGLLTDGAYREYPLSEVNTMEDIPVKYRRTLHPTVVRIREQGIVINACLKPDRVCYLYKVEKEVRQEFSKIPEVAREASFVQDLRLMEHHDKSPVSMVRRTHRKSYSTGVIERASKMMMKTSKVMHSNESLSASLRVQIPNKVDGQGDSSGNAPQTPFPKGTTAAASQGGSSEAEPPLPMNPRRRDRSHSAPPMPFEVWRPQGSGGGFENLYLESQRICRQIVTKRPLPEWEMITRAFRFSEVIVKHYLTNELSAKYQSAY